MTSIPGLAPLKYDAWNRLVEVDQNIRYDYNGLNQRIKKTIAATVTRSFFTENWQELESVIGAETTTYVWGLRYVDDLISWETSEGRSYALQDANWNVVALCDVDGDVLERYTYDGFGKRTALLNSEIDFGRAFTCQVLDDETGLMLYRNRFYHNGLGRFISRDPIGYQSEDKNLYRYIFNAPATENDSFGLKKRTPIKNWPHVKPLKPANPSEAKCSIAIHCWKAHYLDVIPTPGSHCGLTVRYKDGSSITYDGPGGEVNKIDNYDHPNNVKVYPSIQLPESTCDCLQKYQETFNSAPDIPRSSFEGNSNWVLSCMVNKCGLAISWEKFGAPFAYGKPPCKKYRLAEDTITGSGACMKVCDEYYTCP